MFCLCCQDIPFRKAVDAANDFAAGSGDGVASLQEERGVERRHELFHELQAMPLTVNALCGRRCEPLLQQLQPDWFSLDALSHDACQALGKECKPVLQPLEKVRKAQGNDCLLPLQALLLSQYPLPGRAGDAQIELVQQGSLLSLMPDDECCSGSRRLYSRMCHIIKHCLVPLMSDTGQDRQWLLRNAGRQLVAVEVA